MMPNEHELIATADTIVAEMRSFIDRRLSEVEQRFEQRVTASMERAAQAEQKTLNYMSALPKGKDGRDGRDGEDGKVDYDALDAMMEKMVANAVGSIPVPDRGPQGEKGKDADPEAITATLRVELMKEVSDLFGRLPRPRDGIDGQDGRDGVDGKQGEAGRDAAEIEIVNINDVRRYGRGTWGKFAGGLWRAARSTDPIAGAKSLADAGWDCMVAGIGEITGQLDTESRTLRLSIEAGETIKELSFSVPMMLFRGAHEIGREYAAGDVVASDGSGWVANCGTKGIPGASPDWNLIAKKGRDFRPIDRNMQRNDEPIKLR